MEVLDKTGFYKILVKSLLKLILAGVVIGLLHAHDAWVAIILLFHMGRKIYPMVKFPKKRNLILLYGMILTGICGVLAEKWGIYNGYWEYHDLTNQRTFPYWLPIAWMLSFYFIYDLETKLLQTVRIDNISNKIILALLIAAIFPALGEMVTIALGVWTYHWPWQILGVPLYAIIALLVLDLFVQLVLVIYCEKYKVFDPVYSKS